MASTVTITTTDTERIARGRRRRRRQRSGFSLVEVMLAAIILGICATGVAKLYTFCRRTTEDVRNNGEAYIVAREEIERDKDLTYEQLFTNSGCKFLTTNPLRTDYDQTGKVLTSANLSKGAAATSGAYYRAVSTYYILSTGNDTNTSGAPGTTALGVHQVLVYRLNGGAFTENPTTAANQMYPELMCQSAQFYSTLSAWR